MTTSFQNWHPQFPVNLQNCKDEPIHIPGAVQTFGFLIAFDPASRTIRAVSENALQWIPELEGFDKKSINIDHIATVEETSSYIAHASQFASRRLVRAQISIKNKKTSLFGVLYPSNGLEVLEVELQATADIPAPKHDYLTDLPTMMRDISSQPTLEKLMDFTAQKIKALTGFDRVMIYRYDREWNGEVIAEAKEKKLETFLGLHYPASDIPAQARALYEKNWIRLIPTVNYKPAKILPDTHQSLDLSSSVLRSVSPIHIQYLKNMGVGASMSISLMVDGKLWGLIACHHYSEHYVPLNVRLGCEAYGQLVSWHIRSVEIARVFEARTLGEATLHRVLKFFSEIASFQEAARCAEADLLSLFQCTGIIIRLGEESVKLGADPGEEYTSAVAKSLINQNILEPLVTREFEDLPKWSNLQSIPEAAGFMALALAPRHNYYIICIRPEETETVNWAGDPHEKEKLDFSDPAVRLQPRGSFALWQEIHRGKCAEWNEESVDLLKRFGLLFVKIVIERREMAERSNVELKTVNRAKDEFVAMVSHELRTPLNAIIGWTELALSGELHKDKFSDALKIIQRNARSQNQLVSDLLDVSRIISGKMKLSIRNMRMSEVVESVVLSFVPVTDSKSLKVNCRLDSEVDSIIGDPIRIQQVIWNLVSNAVKFSSKGANIWIDVHRENSHIELQVRDEGVGLEPHHIAKIFERFQQVDSSLSRKTGGLGLGLAISKHIVELHGGRIEVKSEGIGKGSTFTAIFPISPIRPEAPSEPVDMPIGDSFEDPEKDVATSKKRLADEVILVVEDETDAAKFIEMLLLAHGAKVHVAHNGEEALEVLEKHKDEISVVLSDVGMPKMDGYQLLQNIRSSPDKRISSICAVALTAFGRTQDRITALRSGFDSYIAKPVSQEELLTVLESACKAKKR